MRTNVNLLTESSESATARSITGYENAVAAHIYGDWGVHNQVRYYSTPFAEYGSGNTITNGYLLRVQLTGTNGDGTGDGAFTLPAILSGSGITTGGLPIIIRQPQAAGAAVGQSATFTVKAISSVPMTYQWYRSGTAISGATSSTLVLGAVTSSDQAYYSVTVTNDYGSVTSNSVTLIVSAYGVAGEVGCFTGDTPITMADGSTKQIKDVKAGDRVKSYAIKGLSRDDENAWKTWKSSQLIMEPAVATVKEVFKRSFVGYYRILDLSVTFEHPLLCLRNGIWQFQQAQMLKRGDFLWKNGASVPVGGINYIAGNLDTYNLNVEPDDVYVAGGFLAHNSFFKDLFSIVSPVESAIIFG